MSNLVEKVIIVTCIEDGAVVQERINKELQDGWKLSKDFISFHTMFLIPLYKEIEVEMRND